MLNPHHPERRYPPTRYPGDVERTRRYRDGWDEGWDFAKRRGVREAIEHFKERGQSGPYMWGAFDGIVTWCRSRGVLTRAEAERLLRRW